jgi:hypothetical protein
MNINQAYNTIVEFLNRNNIQVTFTNRGYPIHTENGDFFYGYEFKMDNREGRHRIVYSLDENTFSLYVITADPEDWMVSHVARPIENATSLNSLVTYFC